MSRTTILDTLIEIDAKGGSSLVTTPYDYISMGYTGSNLTSVIYKSGGVSGTTVATLTLVYSNGILQSVTKT